MKAITVSFVLSLVGVSYQIMSYELVYVVDSRYTYISSYNGFGIFSILFGVLVGFWAISHLQRSRESELATWSAIILALGGALLGNLIIFWTTTPSIEPFGTSQMVPAEIVVTLLPSPVLYIAGGLIGLKAARHRSQ